MRQLTGLDASFLYSESVQTPNHVASAWTYDPTTAPDAHVTFDQVVAHLGSRLHLARGFREKVVEVPLGLDHPWWVDDRNFDIEYHVRRTAVPSVPSWRGLCDLLAELHSRPLDRSRPLWEFHMIEGLAGVNGLPEGGFACYMKVHHAAVDGVSGMEMVAALHDLEPAAEPPAPTSAWEPNEDPSPAWLLHLAMVHAIGRPMHGVRTARRVLPALSRIPLGASRSGVTLPSLRVPKTRFNGAVSAHRVIEARSYPLDDMKRMRKAVDGATINDAALATVGGALRRYLVRHGELPKSALTALVPVSVRPEELVGSAGNQISLMSVTLGTDVADPLERLATVSAASKRSKGFASAVGARTLSDVSQLFPGKFLGLGMRAVTRAVAAGAQNLLFNTTVTNVPGPRDPLYFCGARAVEPYGAGPFAHGAGLIHLLGSYCGRMTFNVTACREMMPDPAFYGDCIDGAFDELLGAAS